MAYNAATSFAGQGGTPARAGGPTTGAPGGGAAASRPVTRPVTIRMLHTAQRVGDGVFVIDGKEVAHVIVVGRIQEHEHDGPASATAKHYGYVITDGSGSLRVRHWLDPNNKEEERLSVGSYMRAIGSVKEWEGKLTLTGTVRFMLDNNELTYHFLETILTHLRLTKGHRPAAGQRKQVTGTGNVVASGAPAAAAGGGENVSLENAIHRCLHQGNRAIGTSFDQICASVTPRGFSAGDVRSMLKAMVAEGTLYTTDDIHYNF